MQKTVRLILFVSLAALLLIGLLAVGAFWLLGPHHGRAVPVYQTFPADQPLRGLMVRSYHNADFPSAAGLEAEQLAEEAAALVDYAEEVGANALLVELSPASDALYRSEVLPTSAYLLAHQGDALRYDVLDTLLETAHAAGIRVIGVIHPTRVAGASDDLSGYTAEHLAVSRPDYVVTATNGDLVIDPTQPEGADHIVAVVEDLITRYALDGIHLDPFCGTGRADGTANDPDALQTALTGLLERVNETVHRANPNGLVGITASGLYGEQTVEADALDIVYEPAVRWMQAGWVDYLTVQLGGSLDAESDGYAEVARYWGGLEAATGCRAVVQIESNGGSDALAVQSQSFLTRSAGLTSYLIDGLTALQQEEPAVQGAMIRMLNASSTSADAQTLTLSPTETESSSSAASESESESESGSSSSSASSTAEPEETPSAAETVDIEVSNWGLGAIPQTFAVTRPADAISVTSKTYYILGTSDPALALTVNGEAVEDRGSQGCWGYLAELEMGDNTFVFAQGDQQQTVTINRYKASSSATIKNIQQNSMLPKTTDAFFVESGALLRCIAPSGATVTATLGGVTVELSQVAATAERGIAATFKGTATFDADAYTGVQKLGAATYTMTYNGETKSYTSNGEYYLVGADSDLKIIVGNYLTSLFDSEAMDGPIVENLIEGGTDYVVGTEGDAFELSMGGYIDKSYAEIILDDRDIDNRVSAAFMQTGDRYEQLILEGTASPVFRAEQDETGLTVRLFNTTGVATPDISACTLIQDLQISEEDGVTTLRFEYSDREKVWGYSVEYDGTHTVIYLKEKPTLSDNAARPLEGITIALDPGHGAGDGGAVGPPAANGPVEKDMNLAAAYAAREVFTELGATVIMTRSDDSRIILADRVPDTRALKPDFFISLHHNSAAESTDGMKSQGIEVYYHYDHSLAVCEEILQELLTTLGRTDRSNGNGPIYGTFLVTRVTYAPSMLVEIGFMNNPVEYEDCCNPYTLYKTALALAQGVMNSLQ